LIRRLWTEERVSAVGDYYQTVDVTIYDRPDRPVPIYIAAGGPIMARYAGRAGDGFICTSGKGMDLYTEQLMPAVEQALAARADRPDQFDRMIEIKLSFDTDADRALEDTRFWAPLSLTAEQKAALEDPAKMEQAADELPIEQVAKRWIVASDPEEAVAAIRPYLDAGLNHLVFHAPGHDQSRFLTLFEEHLMPRIRALAS
jgi:coenzyme F420-dependent glucose-6-phosphate dehydrogenase